MEMLLALARETVEVGEITSSRVTSRFSNFRSQTEKEASWQNSDSLGENKREKFFFREQLNFWILRCANNTLRANNI